MGKSKKIIKKNKVYFKKDLFLFNLFKDSMEKFNQLARRFSMRKDTTINIGKYSKQTPM